jgi:AcrR family transcriptional regulator
MAIKTSKTDRKKTIKYHKETFEKIQEEKRLRILKEAINEFASKGFSTANINDIAKNSGISIGSMYNYFESKDNLFLTVMHYGYELIEKALSAVAEEQGDIFAKLEKMLRICQVYSRKYKKITQVYLDATSEGLAHLSRQLSREVETITAKYHHTLITQAQEQGIVDKKIDPGVISFCIDNIVLIMQFSYTTEYYAERMKIFAGDKSLKEDERIVQGIMFFLRGALAPRK